MMLLYHNWEADASLAYKKRRVYTRRFGAPAETRTPDTLIKSQVLYRLSYRGKKSTLVIISQKEKNVKSKVKKSYGKQEKGVVILT